MFGALEGNRAVYFDTVSSIIESAVSGFNATIFAYGQEGLNHSNNNVFFKGAGVF